MNTPEIKFEWITKNSTPRTTHLKDFTRVYQEAFAMPPYRETYSDEDIRNEIWLPHIANGLIVLALDDDMVVGLGCALSMNEWAHDEEFQDFIKSKMHMLPNNMSKICWMSDVAVLPSHWRRGIATKLVEERIKWATRMDKYSHYMMRTAAEDSNSLELYLKLKAWVVKDLIQDVTDHAEKVSSDSDKRIFLAGEVPMDEPDFICRPHC